MNYITQISALFLLVFLGIAKPQVTFAQQSGYTIQGVAKGVPNGTKVSLLNAQNGAVENSAVVQGEKFVFSGSVPNPDMKVLTFNNNAPFIFIFMENVPYQFNGTAGKLENAVITGSKAHDEYLEFAAVTKPYDQILAQQVAVSSVAQVDSIIQVLDRFIEAHPDSYITPIAMIRQLQLFSDAEKAKGQFNKLTPRIKQSQYGQYIAPFINQSGSSTMGATIANFSQADVSGKQVSINSFKGKYVLIDFWASWCGPCRRENPNIVAAFEKYKNKNFTVLGISLDDNKDRWLNAIEKDKLTWTQLSDLKGWGNAVAQQFGISSIPQNILIDPNGKIIGVNLRGIMLEYKLSKIL